MSIIKIAIATNINFYKKTLPIILPSLIENGIDKEHIHVFIGGYEKYNKENNNGIEFHYLNHNSYEYSPLIEIVDKELKSDYWFLIHDTCKVGPNFKEFINRIPENCEKISINRKPAMSMGLYGYNYLMSIKEKILSIKNTDYSENSMEYWKNWGVPNEDWLMWMTEPTPLIYNNDVRWWVVDNDNWFGTDTIRRTEYYPSVDLYKNKSNWGQSPILKRNI